MNVYWRNGFVLALAALPVAGVGASSASAQPISGCYARIETPSEGSGVGLTGAVQGSSAIDADTSVWVLTHRKGLSEWWPQNGGPVQGGTTDWTAKVTYGTKQEAGQPFEIVAIPVDRRTNEGLVGWSARANAYNDYSGIPLPNPAKGCRYNVVEVQREQ
jgi:hypothetical protein